MVQSGSRRTLGSMTLTAARLRKLIPTCRNGVELEQKVMALSIAKSKVAVTVADPNLPDVPLVCRSDGFETLTGYSRSEVIGRNCRFLNKCASGSGMSSKMRERLRECVAFSLEFIDILPNEKKSGEPFSNLFHLTSFVLRGRKYLIGMQVDVTNAEFAGAQSQHVEELRRIAERIFAWSLDAWVLMQSHDHPLKLYSPFSKDAGESVPSKSPKKFNQFIINGLDWADKNTFILAKDDVDEACTEEHGLQWSAPSPRLHESDTKLVRPPGLSLEQENAVVATSADIKDTISQGVAGEKVIGSDPGIQLPPCDDETERIVAPDLESERLKSVGSADHPNGCTECSFYFFSRTGCKNGVDCRFCHVVHPRKAKKKNRVVSSKTSSPERLRQPNVKVEASGGTSDALPTLKKDPSEGVTCVTEAPSLHTTGSAIPSMSYGARRDASELCPGPDDHFDFAVGEKVYLPISIDLDVKNIHTLLPTLMYSIKPTLPPGLNLDRNSGTISGVCESAHSLSVYTVVSSINCYADGGAFVGLVRVASCSFSLRVVGMTAGS